VQGVTNPWQRVAVLFREVIYSTAVYAEAKAAIFLPDEHHKNGQELSDSSITPLPFMSSSMSFTSASFAKGNLGGDWRMGWASPVSVLWYNFSARP
jgi:hypothetical protein